MDISKLSPERQEIVKKIALLESEKRFDEDVENDPPTTPLDVNKVDFLNKKLSSKIKTAVANKIAYSHFSRLIKKGVLKIEEVKGENNLEILKTTGAILTCNHFSPFDNFVVLKGVEKYLKRKILYKIIREGNYTSFPGLYGFFFRNCNTLPLSSNPRGTIKLLNAVDTLLKNGKTILIYPEQAMWWNYRKPRPFKTGAFKMAFKSNVPVVPTFITMEDSDEFNPDGSPIQKHTLHVLPAIYPDRTLNLKDGTAKMMQENFDLWVKKYEEVYGVKYDL